MAHTIKPAASGRARCRGCGRPIAKGELRLGERVPNPFADEGDTTLWFHLSCGAFKRPEALLEALADHGGGLERSEWLAAEAKRSVEHRRLPRLDGAERSSTGRAACRACRGKIPKASWRIRLVYFDDARFVPSGFIHAGCAGEYLGTVDLAERLACLDPDLSAEDRADLERALLAPPARPA